jgi:hypothetical protein
MNEAFDDLRGSGLPIWQNPERITSGKRDRVNWRMNRSRMR